MFISETLSAILFRLNEFLILINFEIIRTMKYIMKIIRRILLVVIRAEMPPDIEEGMDCQTVDQLTSGKILPVTLRSIDS